ncbi:TA system toxin CbtA family protein [Citrobacter freundii]|uniref:TA system toxin CbtA family protein n=1 Tax=Citrobacter freundii TaxID=546 RepID=UPI000B5AB1B8|nr:TA system toxin CbtA family protein [Citrobacter freundii]ECM4445207.1 toxin CbtA [Salmonella enterica subsp. enterica serovar Senftenberg]EDT3773727.1 toxin CbtA [Salmonella enterica subsp. enterica serovar Gaminara]POV58447.1 toxin CbtA [Citrobacter freundii complex sp. CFNIH11]ASK01149.1 toxin CbtA [Citrobacter freundii]EKU1546950.1 toxin CbtA [Citrobacter freundii]
MQTLSAIPTRKAPSHPTPVEIWQQLLTYLLKRHYGLSLSDTQFSDEKIITQYIDAGISLSDALNFLVEKSELVRIDRPGLSIKHQSPFIGVIDILRARRATGLMQRNGYKRITLLIAGNAAQEQHS